MNLLHYLDYGMELTKIHRIITFHQAKFIKPFIDLCAKMRKLATTKAEQDMWKLFANCIYGKVRKKK